MVHSYPGRRGFSWNFSSRKSERATKRRHRWQRVAKRRGEKGFFSLSSQFRNGDLFISGNRRFEHQFSFGKFHRRHGCTATTDFFLEHGENFFASDEQNDVVIRMDRCVQAVREIHSRPLSLSWLWPCPSAWTTCKSAMHGRRSSEFDRQWGRNIVGP